MRKIVTAACCLMVLKRTKRIIFCVNAMLIALHHSRRFCLVSQTVLHNPYEANGRYGRALITRGPSRNLYCRNLLRGGVDLDGLKTPERSSHLIGLLKRVTPLASAERSSNTCLAIPRANVARSCIVPSLDTLRIHATVPSLDFRLMMRSHMTLCCNSVEWLGEWLY